MSKCSCFYIHDEYHTRCNRLRLKSQTRRKCFYKKTICLPLKLKVIVHKRKPFSSFTSLLNGPCSGSAHRLYTRKILKAWLFNLERFSPENKSVTVRKIFFNFDLTAQRSKLKWGEKVPVRRGQVTGYVHVEYQKRGF